MKNTPGPVALAIFMTTAAIAAPDRPDIVVILADDMGFSDLGCYGSEIPTPAIDSIARNGVRYSNFHTCARCSPSRASLLTGKYPQAVGVGNLDKDWGLPGYRGFLDPASPTLAERLREAGYFTALAGKWHLGSGKGHLPWDRGFMRSRGLLSGAADYFKPLADPRRSFGEDGRLLKPSDFPADFYMTHDIAATAVRHIGEAPANKPLFLYVAFTAPHRPIQAPEASVEARLHDYEAGPERIRAARLEKEKKLGVIPAAATVAPHDFSGYKALPEGKRAKSIRDMATYAAQITEMDEGVGRILAALKKSGRDGNTLLVFLSDNGASDESTSYGADWAAVSNTPFRSYKAHTYRGGTSDPLIVSLPGMVAPGRIETRPAHIVDLAPTVLKLAGLAPSAGTDGVPLDLNPASPDAPWPERRFFWEHEGRRGVLDASRKLVAEAGAPWELYAVDDTGETKNLAAAEPETIRRLAEAWNTWAAAHRVTLPDSRRR